jgi:hypothetical protein
LIKDARTIQSINILIILTLLVVDALLMAAMLVPIPFMKVEQCGVFDLTGMARIGNSYAITTGNCFEQAYFACRPATLTYVNNETQSHVITIEKHFIGCNITDTVRFTNGSMETTTYTCAGVHFLRWGLIINDCGDDHDLLLLGRIRLR